MMNYIVCEQIDPYDLSGNLFGYNHKEKNKFVDFRLLTQDALTFEINGHEASVWYQYDELHIM